MVPNLGSSDLGVRGVGCEESRLLVPSQNILIQPIWDEGLGAIFLTSV